MKEKRPKPTQIDLLELELQSLRNKLHARNILKNYTLQEKIDILTMEKERLTINYNKQIHEEDKDRIHFYVKSKEATKLAISTLLGPTQKKTKIEIKLFGVKHKSILAYLNNSISTNNFKACIDLEIILPNPLSQNKTDYSTSLKFRAELENKDTEVLADTVQDGIDKWLDFKNIALKYNSHSSVKVYVTNTPINSHIVFINDKGYISPFMVGEGYTSYFYFIHDTQKSETQWAYKKHMEYFKNILCSKFTQQLA